VLNSTFNNISVICWWSVLMIEETGVPGENHGQVASHIMFYRIGNRSEILCHSACEEQCTLLSENVKYNNSQGLFL
jgi:hypothetical protein